MYLHCGKSNAGDYNGKGNTTDTVRSDSHSALWEQQVSKMRF